MAQGREWNIVENKIIMKKIMNKGLNEMSYEESIDNMLNTAEVNTGEYLCKMDVKQT